MAEHRILVIEDDLDIRESLMEILTDHGYQPIPCIHGRQALDHLRASVEPPCLILLDLMMPVMDGRTFREEQMRHPTWSSIPVVVISASRDLGDSALQLQAVAHLSKPLSLRELMRIIREHCPANDV